MSGLTSALFQRVLHHETKRNENDPAWLVERRHHAFSWISEHNFPTLKNDTWKHSQIASILDIPFEPAGPGKGKQLSTSLINQAGEFGGIQLIFVNGYFVRELSSLEKLPQEVKVESLTSEFSKKNESLQTLFSNYFQEHIHAFTALNAACTEDGAFIRIPANTVIEEPIHLVFLWDINTIPRISHPRSLILAEAGSSITIIETYTGPSASVYLTNAVTGIILGERAIVNHYKIQDEAETAFHIAFLDVRQERDSQFTTYSIDLGSRIARNEVRNKLQSSGATSILNGLYMPRNEQHLDNITMVEHAAPHCTSRELYKGVVDGQGSGNFDGRIVVCADACKTDAKLINKNLLLSSLAHAYTRPQLEIFADDVKCSHGATVSQLNKDALFYLRARGISQETAQHLMTYAFVNEMLELIQIGTLRSHIEKKIASRLSSSNDVEIEI